MTHVDKEVETLVISSLKEKYPDHEFLGEESASEAGELICCCYVIIVVVLVVVVVALILFLILFSLKVNTP